MARARNGEVELEYEAFGPEGRPAVLLINGLGSQMTRWPEPFCEILVGRGFRAVRFDNRDAGLSTWMEGARYALADMAGDAMAVLDALGIAAAHLAGVSMGGMIAQRAAIDHPRRVLSLTSIMSATGAPGSLASTPEAAAVLNTPPPDPARDYEAYIAAAVANARTIGSPAYPFETAALRARAVSEHRRGFNPEGVARQRQAIMADGDRTAALGGLAIPAVVLHGTEDPLLLPRAGEMTAAAIPGAELRLIPGMGHDVPPGLYEVIADAICAAAARASSPR